MQAGRSATVGLSGYGGGNGADDFIFSIAPNANDADLILDFQTGQDRLLLSSSQFGLPQGALAAGSLAFGSAAQDASDRLIYHASLQRLLFDADQQALTTTKSTERNRNGFYT